MTFTNNAEFETRVATVIGTDASWFVTDPDLDIDPEAYNEFSPMGCDICVGGAGSVTRCTITAGGTDTEVDICQECRYALEYGYSAE
jgi:hypothetical protein